MSDLQIDFSKIGCLLVESAYKKFTCQSLGEASFSLKHASSVAN